MILNALYELYERLVEQGEELPRMGFSSQEIGFRIIISPQGDFVRIEDVRAEEMNAKSEKKGGGKTRKLKTVKKILPGNPNRSGIGLYPCFLWDNTAYLLGCESVKERALEYFAETRRKHIEVEQQVNSPKYSAVCRFFEKWQPNKCEIIFNDKALLKTNGVFRVQGDEVDVHEDVDIVKWWQDEGNMKWCGGKEKQQIGYCLVTGHRGVIAPIHAPAIKGVLGSKSSGAKIVSFEPDAFRSYGKDQSYNAPVSEYASFAYCNALNYLLKQKQTHLLIGDATVVFWTDSPQKTREENELFVASSLDAGGMYAMDEALMERIRSRVKAIASGRPVEDVMPQANHIRFYILGLSPNASRLSVRFFHESTLGDFARNLQDHFTAMAIQRRGEKSDDPFIITPYLILRAAVRNLNDLPPLYGGALMRAILTGSPYPDAIAMAILRRIRLPRNKHDKQEAREKERLYSTTVWIFGHLRNRLKNTVLRGGFAPLRLDAA